MLKTIDPHVVSSSKSRYNNKLFIGDTIFICTNDDILRWYMGEDDELRSAFFRRIKYVMEFDDLTQDMISHITVNTIQTVNGCTIEWIFRYGDSSFCKCMFRSRNLKVPITA